MINEESNLTAEEYSDDFFSIKKVKHGDISEDDKYLAIKRKNKKNFIVYKVFGYIIILLMLLIFIIVIIVLM
ncbi:hypothetical protein STURON_00159 [Spiroplasma turonicum]|uniref:Uncharacterized protein n=1 Tax=Spiroplasma turonicum TaxID=216946 RepID=A0A0K1P542_9MOLU|nr:hypothetical protein STURON_00159 [Spiroplasma turonicum]